LRETQVALEGITVSGKSLREHLEAINHRDAIQYVQDLVGWWKALSEQAILKIHSLVLKGIDERQAGHYRQQNVVITCHVAGAVKRSLGLYLSLLNPIQDLGEEPRESARAETLQVKRPHRAG
jgi:hypothetical protein